MDYAKLTLEQFHGLPGKVSTPARRNVGLASALNQLTPGHAVVIGHGSAKCNHTSPKGYNVNCSLRVSFSRFRKNHPNNGCEYVAKHLADGRFAVACVAKE